MKFTVGDDVKARYAGLKCLCDKFFPFYYIRIWVVPRNASFMVRIVSMIFNPSLYIQGRFFLYFKVLGRVPDKKGDCHERKVKSNSGRSRGKD